MVDENLGAPMKFAVFKMAELEFCSWRSLI